MAKRETNSQDNRFPEWWRRKALRKFAYEQNWRGMKVMRAWPQPKGQARTPAEAAAESDFKKLAYAQMNGWIIDRIGAGAIAQGSQYTWRDVLGRALVGRLIEMIPLTPEAFDVADIQLLLDQISDQVGAMLMRSPTQWVALVNPSGFDVITWDPDTNTPVWGSFPASGISQLTGPVTAGPGSGSVATTITATGVTPGSYTNTNLTVGTDGRITSAANGTDNIGITELTGPVTAGPGSGSVATTITPTGVTPATYTAATVTIGADGRISGALSGPAPPAAGTGEVVIGWQPGTLYAPPITNATVGFSTNGLYAIPMPVPLLETIGTVGIYNTSSVAGSEVTVGVYDNNNGYPGTLLANLAVIATTANGAHTAAATATPIAGPFVWLAIHLKSGITMVQSGGSASLNTYNLGVPAPHTAASTASGYAKTVTYASGNLPTPFPSGAAIWPNIPAIWVGQ